MRSHTHRRALPQPASALGGGGGGTPWSRERIVEAALLRAELAAEQAQRTPLLVVNLEGGHFRFRCFHSVRCRLVVVVVVVVVVLPPAYVPPPSLWLCACVSGLFPLLRRRAVPPWPCHAPSQSESRAVAGRWLLQAEAVTPAVQADADAILVLQGSLVPAAAGWPRTHAFPELPPVRAAAGTPRLDSQLLVRPCAALLAVPAPCRVRCLPLPHPTCLHPRPPPPQPRQVSAFTALLLREQWEQLSPEERRHSKQLHVGWPAGLLCGGAGSHLAAATVG